MSWNTTWGNNNQANQQQQPQQQTNAFGQPVNAFAQPAFGQPTAPQQPAATGFGAFGGNTFGQPAAAQPSTSGFGAFGAPAATPSQQPTSTFGGFGANTTAQNGSSNIFGRPAVGFGAAATTAPAGSALFGGAAATGTINGTASPAYAPFQEKDNAAGSTTTLHYQSITAMPAYRNSSFEELRLQDYAQGRKIASNTFGGTTAFGAAATNPPAGPSTGFGAFGQPQQAATPSAFGGGAGTTGVFGGATTNTFGQQPTTFGGTNNTFGGGTTGAFGQPAQPAQQPSAFGGGAGAFGGGTGAFGAAAQPAATTGFGAFAAKPSAFGTFGNPATQPQTTTSGFGAFGQNNQQQPTTGAFGQTQPAQQNTFGTFGKPSVFGQPQQTTTAFGQPQNQENKPATGFGAFGAANTGTTNTFGQPTTGFGLGANTQQQPPPQQQQSSLFGNAFGANQQNQQQQQQQQQQAAGTGTFGGLFNKPATPTPSLFGGNAFGQNNNQQQQPTLGLGATTTTQPTGGLFGGFGLGGQQQQQQQPQQQQPQQGTGTGGFGLFGGATNAAPPTGTLFGGTNTLAPPVSNAAAPSGSVFGKPALGFGQQTAPAFGQTGNAFAQPQQTGFGLGQSQAQQQPPVLTASIDHNIFNTNPLLARLQPGPQLIRLNEPEKTPEAPPLQYSRRHFTKQQPPKLGKLRGFSTPPPAFGTSDAREQSPFRTSSVEPGLRSASPSKLLTGLSDSIASGGSPSGILGPDAFKSRSSVKKLVLPHRIDPNDFEGSVRANVDAAKAGKLGTIAPDRQKPVGESIKWNPHMESAARDALTSPSMTESLPSSASLSTPLRPRPGSRINPSASASSSALSPAKDTSPSLSPPKSATGSAPFDLTKLKHGEYWARPPIAELQSYGFAQLQNLESLTVGRIDYGEVTFLSKVDVTSIKAISDIPGGIVLFNERECIVYPDEEIKPPVGEGLNVPAKITLLGCWALDKATREPVKDVEAPRYKQHLKKLKSMKDTEFLSFDNEKGTWVFKVPHFTRYGIDDEEMEESDADANADLPDELMDTDRSRPPVYEINLHSTIPALMSHRENPTDPPPSSDAVNRRANVSGDRIIPPPTKRKTPEHETVQPSRKPWASSLGLDSRRIQVMQASFFGDAGADPLPPPLGRSSILPSFPTSVRRQERANVDMDEESDGGNLASAIPVVNKERPVINTNFQTHIPSGKYVPKNIPTGKSVSSGFEACVSDAGLAFGRSFRAGWGPGGTLVHSGKICAPTDNISSDNAVVSITSIKFTARDQDDDTQRTKKALELQRQHSRIETDASGVPKAIADTALRFQHFAELFEPDDQSHESSMWRLCRALFDEIDDGIHDGTLPDVRARISSLRRKTSLSDWLAETVAPSVEKDLRQESTSRAARRLFLLMTGHQLERAAQLAFDVGDFNLSLLLPQAGGDADFRNDIEQLLEAWTDQHLDAHIDMSYRKVYALLQGIVDHLPGSKSTDVIELSQDVNISEGLDWKRVFGLHLWFANSLEEPTRDALSSYFETSESNPEYASPPLPWYIEDRSANSKSARRGVHDSQFELIKLATDETTPLESAIDPLGFGPNPLSYRLPWHIYLVLSRILHGRDFSDRSVPGGNADVELSAVEGISAKANAVCCNFALQLECQGLWQFAVFVLLHLELANSRREAVLGVLCRNAEYIEGTAEEFLLNDLHIPIPWVLEAKGTLARYRNNYVDAFQFYKQSGSTQTAHDIAVRDLAPDAILQEDVSYLKSMFADLQPREVQDWQLWGKVFFDYAECLIRMPPLIASLQDDAVPDVIEAEELKRLSDSIPEISQRVPAIFQDPHDWRHRICVPKMLSRLLQLTVPLQQTHRPKIRPGLVPEATQLKDIQSKALQRFLLSIEASA